MSSDSHRLGTSKVTAGNRIVLVKEVAEELSIEPGDVVAFFRAPDGRIWLRKLE